jgi:L-arabinokinase
MRRLVSGSLEGGADAAALVARLADTAADPVPEVRPLFEPGRDIVVARAPGRLDVMGGIADYSGSRVLQWPTREATGVALQRVPERVLRIVSVGPGPRGAARTREIPLAALEDADGHPVSYESGARRIGPGPAEHWATYVAGAWLALAREAGVRFPDGARVLVVSEVPESVGVSSSAALEVATLWAVCGAYGLHLPADTRARLCQIVENRVAGAPCGIMDQMTAALGCAGRLLRLRCQPAVVEGQIALPPGLAVWGIDSGVRHAVSGSDYTAVRVGAFMGYRVIAGLARLPVHGVADGTVRIDDNRWGGYLANLSPAEFEAVAGEVPEVMNGAAFLARFGGITDTVTRVDPARDYAVRVPAAHAVYEHARVRAFAQALGACVPDGAAAGRLMQASHESYSACGLGSAATDRLVELVRARGVGEGLFGARITGGGSGGTVAVLGSATAGPVVDEIAAVFAREAGHRPHVFSGSSPGAAGFGHLVVR